MKASTTFTLNAREIFLEVNGYSQYELIGYCRLVKALCKRTKKCLMIKLK